MRLFEMIDLADMPGRMSELEADALAMAAGRKAPALYHGDLVRHVGVGPVDDRLVKAGLGDPGLEIVADRLAGDTAEISEGADMCRDPIRQLLAPHRLGVGEARCAQDGDKNLYRDDLTREAINDLAGAAGEVDKQLLAGDMGLAHRRLQPARPTPVKVARSEEHTSELQS